MFILPLPVFSCGHATLVEALSVRRSVGPLVMIKWKSGKPSVLDTFCVCLCLGGGNREVDGCLMPLPSRPHLGRMCSCDFL